MWNWLLVWLSIVICHKRSPKGARIISNEVFKCASRYILSWRLNYRWFCKFLYGIHGGKKVYPTFCKLKYFWTLFQPSPRLWTSHHVRAMKQIIVEHFLYHYISMSQGKEFQFSTRFILAFGTWNLISTTSFQRFTFLEQMSQFIMEVAPFN